VEDRGVCLVAWMRAVSGDELLLHVEIANNDRRDM
jgi:hypothetical protein